MNNEIEVLVKHGTWELVERKNVSKSRRVTKGKLVYIIKLTKDQRWLHRKILSQYLLYVAIHRWSEERFHTFL